MQFPTNKYDGNVFNVFGSFAITKQPVSTFFNEFNKYMSSHFTMVVGSGETKNYSRIASALDFNWGV